MYSSIISLSRLQIQGHYHEDYSAIILFSVIKSYFTVFQTSRLFRGTTAQMQQ